jgi:hypothetical protein
VEREESLLHKLHEGERFVHSEVSDAAVGLLYMFVVHEIAVGNRTLEDDIVYQLNPERGKNPFDNTPNFYAKAQADKLEAAEQKPITKVLPGQIPLMPSEIVVLIK